MPNLIIIDGSISADFVSNAQMTNGSSSATTLTLSSVTLAVGKLLIATFWNGAGTFSDLTVNGVSAAAIATGGVQGNLHLRYYVIDCAVTSGNIVLTLGGSGANHFGVSVYKLTGGYSSASDAFVNGVAGSAANSTSAPVDSAVVGHAVGSGNFSSFTSSWTGASKDTTDVTIGEAPQFQTQSAAHANVTAAATISLTCSMTSVSSVIGLFLLLSP